MESKPLCDFCDSIDFQAGGVYGAEFDEKAIWQIMFAENPRPLAVILQMAPSCYFCQMLADFITKWVENKYGDPVQLHLENSHVTVAAYRAGSVETSESGRSDGNLIRISATFTMPKPGPDMGVYGPDMVFQSCGANPIHVSDFCQQPSPLYSPADDPYDGRLRPLIADTRLFAKWRDCCKVFHGENCGRNYPGKRPSRLRFIDVEKRCITMGSLEESWVALSYVWGNSKFLKCTRNNLPQLQQPKSLQSKILPRTTDDAIEVTRCLGIRYLWVDSLCIIQDDDIDKFHLIPQMASIYGLAALTIIQASGLSADSGLPGIQETRRHKVQVPFTIKGVTLLETLDPVGSRERSSYLGDSYWNTRGWTFQERLVSGKALIFTSEQIYWECEKAAWCEDSSWEHQEAPRIYRHIFAVEDFRHVWETMYLDKFEEVYRQLVEEYSSRHLTFESDGLDAFTGILEALEKTTNQKFFWGLPISLLGNALAWPCDLGRNRKRTTLCQIKSPDGTYVSCPFPSWSWVGWVGEVYFEQCCGKLTSRTLGFVFYKLAADGQPWRIIQETGIIVPPSRLAPRRDRIKSVPSTWKDESKTEITRDHIPEAVFRQHIEPTILCFWSSTAIFHLKHGAGDCFGTRLLLLSNKGLEITVSRGHHELQCELGLEGSVKCIVIARSSNEFYRDWLQVMLSTSEDGISYRRGLVGIRETDWISLDNRIWEPIILG